MRLHHFYHIGLENQTIITGFPVTQLSFVASILQTIFLLAIVIHPHFLVCSCYLSSTAQQFNQVSFIVMFCVIWEYTKVIGESTSQFYNII